VGNQRKILVSDQGGKSNFTDRLAALKIDYSDEAKLQKFMQEIKEREAHGFSYDGADASFELFARCTFEGVPDFFNLTNFRVMTERRFNVKGELVTHSEATVKLEVGGKTKMTVSEGNGPINALDKALRAALRGAYPLLKTTKLVDYKVRIINPGKGTKAITRVLIETQDENINSGGQRWSTIGVSENVIDASYNAIAEGIRYGLMKAR
jgi:2-isopropylmalate synthase